MSSWLDSMQAARVTFMTEPLRMRLHNIDAHHYWGVVRVTAGTHRGMWKAFAQADSYYTACYFATWRAAFAYAFAQATIARLA